MCSEWRNWWLREMVNPLKQRGNNDSLLSRNLNDVGYILRWRKIMQRVLFLWHFKLSYLFCDQNRTLSCWGMAWSASLGEMWGQEVAYSVVAIKVKQIVNLKCKVFMFCVSILILYPGSLCCLACGSWILAFAGKKYEWHCLFLFMSQKWFFFS